MLGQKALQKKLQKGRRRGSAKKTERVLINAFKTINLFIKTAGFFALGLWFF